MYLSPHPHLDCLPHSSQPPGIATRTNIPTFRLENRDGTREKVNEKNPERGEMSICIALGMMLGRSIQNLYVDIKRKRESKRQQKREQQRLSEHRHEFARFEPSIHSGGGEYQHLSDQGDDHGHTQHHLCCDGRNNPPHLHRIVAPNPLQTLDWMDTEVDPLEDTLPTYDHGAARLPPYDHTLPNSTGGMVVFPRRGRRCQREGRQPHTHDEPLDGNGRRINELQPRAYACTGMRIREHPGLDVDRGAVGGAVIWYDALEDRYEVISRSLATPTEPPLPPPYMPILYGG